MTAWDDPSADPAQDIREWVREDSNAWMYGPPLYAYKDGWYTLGDLAAKLKAETGRGTHNRLTATLSTYGPARRLLT